ncbi:hypothetical protein CROQUDRAFT_662117 [Cronartium quercuum f. sp. fusiforme G11]|uniref:Actin-related protein n=1 Tax=Cronartium quercuum f. sp. fusiforme G11 TaxID=708437 RepID=A0A9P6NEU9_9BASI|nr:hypothetical protein CROQUDRAFT_662117 [Cronartium quercuum f. sp. fusiforme G11]
MAGFRDSNLLIISLSTHSESIQVGLGVSPELILPPTHSTATKVYVTPTLSDQNQNKRWSDYHAEFQPGLIPRSLFTDTGDGTAQIVIDWKALDAFFRHLLFTTLKLSKPPLAQHILLSIPPTISNSTRDKLVQLFFENLQAPALFLADSPLLHLLASNRSSGISIDLGTHSTLLGFVHDSIVLQNSCISFPIGEQDCDDYLISLLLNQDPSIATRLNNETPTQLYESLTNLIQNLKSDGHIKFEPTLSNLSLSSNNTNQSIEEDENSITDVAQAIVSGKVDKLLGRQVSAGGAGAGSNHSRRSTTTNSTNGKKLQAEILKETDTIIISIPSTATDSRIETDSGSVQIPPSSESHLQIGKVRHRHSEPLFSPSVLSIIEPTFNRFGLQEFSNRYTTNYIERAGDGIISFTLIGLKKIDNPSHRREVSETVVLTGQGGLMCRTDGLIDFIAKQISSKPCKIPDYFSEFKSKPELLGFLGGCIIAKLVFNDASSSKLWMSKPDYSKEGPYVSRKIGDGITRSSTFTVTGT